jgi:hypothetical protein
VRVLGSNGINNSLGSTVDGTYPYVLGVGENNGTGMFMGVDPWWSEENGGARPMELPPEKV